ncbi:MAG: LTA synthase family protein [Muribaculaceae bacterium]
MRTNKTNPLQAVVNSRLGGMACNILMAYIVFMVARLVFFAVNISYFADYLSWPLVADMLRGAVVFDTSAIIYVNALYVLLVLFPLHKKETGGYATFTKCVYMTLNGVALAANLADCVYFGFTNRRTTATVFGEFSNEGNLGGIIGTEMLGHWYLVILFAGIMWLMWRLYRKQPVLKPHSLRSYYITQTISLVAVVPLCIAGIRGGFGHAVRPITISNANQYVNRPIEAGIVLNTPFSIIRTIGKKPFVTPTYMSDVEMEALYSPVHHPVEGKAFTPKNVVVLIVESFGSEYSGMLNSDLDGGSYRGFTPFLDSLMTRGTTFKYSFSNGRKSIDGMPSVLSGIPMFVEPFFLTPASLNNVSSIAGELRRKGYYTAFFHGAPNGSMGFYAFARTVGFSDYFGLDEYRMSRPGRDADFDGTWAIWDEPFLQYFCEEMGKMSEPFMTSVFTASSHHPFALPAEYEGKFPEGKVPIHKCIGYTDLALRRFFESASKQPWFANTLFVLTADHTNQSCRNVYETDLGVFSVPIVLYAPGDPTLTRGVDDRPIAQQIDIMPTVLGYLGYDRDYIAFGCDLLNTPAKETFAVSYLNGIYQYVKDDYLLQFDGTRTKAIYRFKSDRLLRNNLVGRTKQQPRLEQELKAVIQQYMQRMNNDQLTIK